MGIICVATVWVGVEIEIQPFVWWIRGGLFNLRNHENSNFDMSMHSYELTFNDHLKYGNASTILIFKDIMGYGPFFPLGHLMQCLRKRCFENMQQMYMRTLMSKCDFSKVATTLLK